MKNVLNLLGIAMRARKIVAGEDLLYKNIKQVSLIFLASDVGPSTNRKVRNKVEYYNIPLVDQFTREELSKAIGKENRVVIGITDAAFKKKILELLEGVTG